MHFHLSCVFSMMPRFRDPRQEDGMYKANGHSGVSLPVWRLRATSLWRNGLPGGRAKPSHLPKGPGAVASERYTEMRVMKRRNPLQTCSGGLRFSNLVLLTDGT